MNVPTELIVGDTWSWAESLSQYPASTWTLSFHFVNTTDAFSVTATASGDDYAVAVAAATTASESAGRYRWSARVTDGSTVTTVAQGWTEVKPNVTAAQDARSQARITLDAINATLQGRATNDQLSVSINGRAISRTPVSELLAWRDQLTEEVRIEEEGVSAGVGRHIRTRLFRGY